MTLLEGVREAFVVQPSLVLLFEIGVAVAIVYGVSLVVYRLYLSPLADFPGPRLAAATQYYEMYYDVISGGGGNFTHQIKEMHEAYGMLARYQGRKRRLTSTRSHCSHQSVRDTH